MAEGWRIVAQRQTTDLTPDGRFDEVMEITFMTAEQVTGTVRIPVGQYTPDYVREVISARAAQISAVHNL